MTTEMEQSLTRLILRLRRVFSRDFRNLWCKPSGGCGSNTRDAIDEYVCWVHRCVAVGGVVDMDRKLEVASTVNG